MAVEMPPAGTCEAKAVPDVLYMDVQADEDDCMATMGYMFERYPDLAGCELAVSPRVSTSVTSESIKMLFMFGQLRRLQLRLDFDDIVISQQMVYAIAELMQLTSLQVLHGSLEEDLDISHWSSLRSLAELKLLPGEQAGLGHQQMQQLTHLSTSLTSLAIRPNPEAITTDSLWCLAGMTHLRELSVCPLPLAATVAELQQLLDMPSLATLQLGVSNAAQVLLFSNVKMPRRSLNMSLLMHDACEPGPAADVLTVISWVLPQHLTSLDIGPLAAACPNDVLVTVATLTRLQNLQLQLVAPPDQHSSGTVELLTLSPCRHLTSLEVLVSSRLYAPFTLKTVSLATLAWPHLVSLRLSLAGKPELMPEALDMCDNFAALRELQLFRPLEDAPLEDAQADHGSNQWQLSGRTASSSWTEWAAAGLGSLGIFSSSSNDQTSAAGLADAATALGSGGPATRLNSATSSRRESPLARDLRQKNLVQQQHWRTHELAHHQHLQQQHELHESAAAHTQHGALYTLQDKQQLPAAVGAFQHHKLMRTGSLFGSGSVSRMQQASSLESNGSGDMVWSPKWLLRSFVPLGSPTASAVSGSADGSGPGLQDQQGSWGLLGACRGVAARTTSLETGLALSALDGTQQPLATRCSRLQHTSINGSSPSAAAALRRTSTLGGYSSSELQQAKQQQQQQPMLSATAAPGLDLAMYRAAGRLLPLNLNYLPNSLTKLCLESYHLVTIGMPEPQAEAEPTQTEAAGVERSSDLCKDQQTTAAGAAEAAGLVEGSDVVEGQQEQASEAPGTQAASAGAGALEGASPDAGQEQEKREQASTPPSAISTGPATAAGAKPADSSMPAASTAPVATVACSMGGSQGVIIPVTANGQCSSHSCGGTSLAAIPGRALPQLPLPHLIQLELDGCRVDDWTMAALLHSSPQLKVLELAGLEGLTDAGLVHVGTLRHLTRLCIEAEDTAGISLASMASICRLHSLKKLHWCSRDSLHGPMDVDLLTAQLSSLTGLRQLVLLVAPDSEAYASSGWRVVLQRRLPLCRLVLRRELVSLDNWGDVPDEAP